MMSYKEYLRIAIRVTVSIAVPIAALFAILLALSDGFKAEGSLEFDAVDGLFFLILIPALSVFLCVLVSPIARLFYTFLDRKNRMSEAPAQSDDEIKS
jgi:hypothetical protein